MARARRPKRSRIALSERCRSPRDLARTLLGGLPPPDLSRHLASCRACRKVLADYLRGQAFPVEYFTPDPGTLAWARAKAAGAADGAPVAAPSGTAPFRIRLTDPVEVAEAPESAIVRLSPKPGGVTRIRTRGLGHAGEILLEPLSPGRILLRYRSAPPGTVVALERSGKSLGKAQKGDAFWRDLGAGDYAIVLHSAEAPRALHLQLHDR